MTEPATLESLTPSQRGALVALVASGRVHMPYVSTFATADLNKLVQLGLARVASRTAFAQVFQPTQAGRKLVGDVADLPEPQSEKPPRPDRTNITPNPGIRIRPYGVFPGVKAGNAT